MESQPKRFLSLIEEANKILITSHKSPDPDAVSSLLLMGITLKLNFPDKEIKMVLEEEPSGLQFLTDYNQIKFMPLLTTLDELKPDLFVIVDANSYNRISRKDSSKIEQYIHENSVKTVIVDHHEPDDRDKTDIYINSQNIAAVQEIYELFFDHLNFQKPNDYAQITMVGLYADSGGFAYYSPRQKQTMELAGKLVQEGVDIEDIKNKINQFTDVQMKVISELTANIHDGGDYSYSFISDRFISMWLNDGHSMAELQGATKPFLDNYIRNVGGRRWGFIVYHNPLEGEGVYSISLRSVGNVKNVAAIAAKFGGGGHKPAAGANLKASSIQEAIEVVRAAIAED